MKEVSSVAGFVLLILAKGKRIAMRRGTRKAECNCCDDGMADLHHDTIARFRDARRPDCM
jgi:hypothetical protein